MCEKCCDAGQIKIQICCIRLKDLREDVNVGKSVASGERYCIRETNVWRDKSEK